MNLDYLAKRAANRRVAAGNLHHMGLPTCWSRCCRAR